jgi:hypothetical protein
VSDDHLVVSLARIFNEDHIDFPDAHLVHILVLVLFHKRGDRAEEFVETDSVDEETLV